MELLALSWLDPEAMETIHPCAKLEYLWKGVSLFVAKVIATAVIALYHKL